MPVVKPATPIEVRKVNPRKGDPNHVTSVSLLWGVAEIADIVKFSIISQVLQPTAFDELRTRQGLGYVVSGGISEMSNVLHASVVVQGDVMEPDLVETQIDKVLTKLMPEKLKNMTVQDFEAHKTSFLNQLLK